jgi:hypothetical protein
VFTDKEMKLWRLALDKAAQTGEIQNAAIALVTMLRNRRFTTDDLTTVNGAKPEKTNIDWGASVINFGKHKGRKIKEVDPSYLFWACDWINSEPELQKRFGNLRKAIINYLKSAEGDD